MTDGPVGHIRHIARDCTHGIRLRRRLRRTSSRKAGGRVKSGNKEFKEFREFKDNAHDCTHVELISALSRNFD